jgi:hypothetical protein
MLFQMSLSLLPGNLRIPAPNHPTTPSPANRAMAIVLITGANRGTGLEYCRQLQARIEVGVEVSSAESVADLLGRLAGLPIDVLR